MDTPLTLKQVLLALLRRMGSKQLSVEQISLLQQIPEQAASLGTLERMVADAVRSSLLEAGIAGELLKVAREFHALERHEDFSDRGRFQSAAWCDDTGTCALAPVQAGPSIGAQIAMCSAKAAALILPLLSAL